MSEEQTSQDNLEIDGELEADLDDDGLDDDGDLEVEMDAEDDDDLEEITSDEVDRVVAALEELMESADSENIRTYLDDASNNIYYLVYDVEDDDEENLDEIAEAA